MNIFSGKTHLKTAFTTDEGLELGAANGYVSRAHDSEPIINEQDK